MTAITAPVVLVDSFVPSTVRWRNAILVGGAVLLTALAAQVVIPLWFTPVPLTGQTFAVLLTSAALGLRLGVMSQGLYVLIGALGLPVYADWEGGWHAATGATGGYLIGFVLAAALIGYLAERRQDRSLLTCVPAMLAGTVVIYASGVTWLSIYLGVSLTKGVELGLTPFLAGDVVKLLAAGALVPALWRLTGEGR